MAMGHLAPAVEGHLAPHTAIDIQVDIASSHERSAKLSSARTIDTCKPIQITLSGGYSAIYVQINDYLLKF